MTKKKPKELLVGAGRPTLMTPEIITKLEQAFALGCSDLEACLFADIGKSTLYNYQERNPEFVERKEQLKETPVLKARSTVVDNLHDPDLAMKYLERKKKDEFSLKTESSLSGTVNILPSIIINGKEADYEIGN